MNYYFKVLKKYAVFNGRARRKEYWMFYFFNCIIVLVLVVIEVILGISPESGKSILAGIYSLAVVIPTTAVGVRRMHDVNKSGWFILVPIYNFLLTVRDGTKGNNKYGPDPKEAKTN